MPSLVHCAALDVLGANAQSRDFVFHFTRDRCLANHARTAHCHFSRLSAKQGIQASKARERSPGGIISGVKADACYARESEKPTEGGCGWDRGWCRSPSPFSVRLSDYLFSGGPAAELATKHALLLFLKRGVLDPGGFPCIISNSHAISTATLPFLSFVVYLTRLLVVVDASCAAPAE
ncbi:hypothetical protein CIHG_07479 [Coccidioides immitis H538.4]|uniref:Uncharacterized protein n=3 Tax=Coccidioides immitis TaxID=5501 RepID=A0A0J8RAK5_COCIT|nr:hypothetical protein CIRG_02383 [Coccidioides immitis RMSCC 2394]KMU80903.1 hypothetical protein CISG_08799 [Coccidioides immitis RMSCC 3703]KMU89672.1 hypothetical protein CIHG_07479 [Coccidioides immitis H538.4]